MRKLAATIVRAATTAPRSTRTGAKPQPARAPNRRAPVTPIATKPTPARSRLTIVASATPKQTAVQAPAPSPANPFLGLLLAKRKELTGSLEETKFDTLAKLGRVAEDDQAQISHEEFISLQRNSMDYQALRQVNAAIDRLNSGEFGVCASCDEPISEKRLKAIPWAKYCVVCQDRVQLAGHDNSDTGDSADESW